MGKGTIFIFVVFTLADVASLYASDVDETPPAQISVNYVSITGLKTMKPATDPVLLTCTQSAMSARSACLATLSPKIQGAAGMIGIILGAVGTLKSPAQSCEKYNKAMKIAETALTAYNAICTAMQSSCETDCDAAIAKLSSDKTALAAKSTTLKAAPDPTAQSKLEATQIDTIDLPANTTAEGIIQKDLATCKKYKWNLAAAGVGLTNMIKQSAVSATCEGQTTVVDCAKDPYNAQCAKAMDCSKPENYQQTYCICQRSPNLPSCPGYNGVNINTQANTSPNSNNADTAKNPSMPSLDSSSSIPVVNAKAGGGIGTSNNSGGLLTGLGGGSGGSGSLGAAKTGGADAKKEKTLNANILGGYDGGGGGGAGGTSSASRSLASENSAYKSYLPGGAKDPSSAVSKFAAEVTGSGSKTNFEKVTDMMTEKRPTLLGN